ncbi:esterase-like activity of phytase family protein [Gillisia sp. M10.2A]|uniref:Esterase-like activity of phytase family protein n=1 Tax=Gillisia lutea TaxID=2909668 RepID=A0ABS9EEG3_9FLAO|nr:esterase-like activity of phytase family protein [Gillisia lutea]MCF4101252.1 esterase-like activity of phytase family protein [Gillisia lutea]
MKKIVSLLCLSCLLISCSASKNISNSKVKITFLDDYIIPEDLEIKNTRVGGLSGIDFYNDTYYIICDHPSNPRFYTASIFINKNKLDTVIISNVVKLDRTNETLKNNTMDMEAIRFHTSRNNFLITSEGSISNGKDPGIYEITKEGKYLSHYSLPDYFKAAGTQKPRNNGVFEGLSISYNNSGFWSGMELPLVEDGPKPKLFPTRSYIRITEFKDATKEAEFQFAMKLGGIKKIPWKYFAVNGLTELLEYAPKQFIVLERAFSAGHGSNGNTVRLFDVNANKATNTLTYNNLRKEDIRLAEKQLIFDFKSIKKQLKEQIIDNIEGMTFGPDLPNGNKSLLLISDNNFNSMGKQISQLILLEVEFKK